MRPYFDVHCHIGMTVSRAPVVGQSTGKCLARMASAGVIGAIPCPTAGSPQARGVLDTRTQHDTIANACKLYPERFPIGLGIAEVRHEQAGVDELDRAMRGRWFSRIHVSSRVVWTFARRGAPRIP